MHTGGDAELRKAFSQHMHCVSPKAMHNIRLYDCQPQTNVCRKQTQSCAIARKALDVFACIADEMVQLPNYGNEQVDNIGKAFNFTPGSYKVPENAADISVPDEMVKKVTEDDSCIMPNFSHAFLSTEWHLIT